MTMEAKDSHALLHIRSAAGCIHQGWVMLADHCWDIIRGGLPVLILCALVGTVMGLLLRATPTAAIRYVLYAVCLLIALLWIIQVAGLVQKYHRLGFFPSLRPLLKGRGKDNRANAFDFWSSGWKDTSRRVLHLFVLMIKDIRHWGSLLGILIVGGFVSLGIALIGTLPYLTLSFAHLSEQMAILMGDSVDMPALTPFYAGLSGLIAMLITFLASLFLLLPLSYFAGSLTQEKQERAKEKRL